MDRLEGLCGSEKGGLIIKKKKNPTEDQNDELIFKKPKVSLLGLDKLAAKKRAEDRSKANEESKANNDR